MKKIACAVLQTALLCGALFLLVTKVSFLVAIGADGLWFITHYLAPVCACTCVLVKFVTNVFWR